MHINILETYPILALIYTFGYKMKNSYVRFYCDNLSVVHVVNNQTSKDAHIMKLVRLLVLKLLEFNIKFVAEHIPGIENVLADSISRFQNSKEIMERYKMKASPEPIPEIVLPGILKM